MYSDQRVVALFRLPNHQHAVDRHAGSKVREKVLAALFSEGAGEVLDFAELGASDARIPLNGRVTVAAGQRQGNRAHQIEVQTRARRLSHFHLRAIGVDTE